MVLEVDMGVGAMFYVQSVDLYARFCWRFTVATVVSAVR